MRPFLQRVKALLVGVGRLQARLILLVVYVLLIPVGLVVRWSSDPLRRRQPAGGNWVPRPPRPSSLDEVRKQY